MRKQRIAEDLHMLMELYLAYCHVFQFEQFYNGRFNGRKLTWLQHLSTGERTKHALLKQANVIDFHKWQGAKI